MNHLTHLPLVLAFSLGISAPNWPKISAAHLYGPEAKTRDEGRMCMQKLKSGAFGLSKVTQLVRWARVFRSLDHSVLTSHLGKAFLPSSKSWAGLCGETGT